MAIQALADGGVKMGLNREQSTRLAAQLMLVGGNQMAFTSCVKDVSHNNEVIQILMPFWCISHQLWWQF